MADPRLILVALLLVACGPSVAPPGPAAPPPAPPPAPKTTPGIGDGAWGSVESARFLVKLPLPERQSWRVEELKGTWWSASHAASQSELSVKTWRASRLVTRDDCKKQIRLWRPTSPDPDARPESVVERRSLDAPSGFDTELTVGVDRTGQSQEILGWAVAVGHTVGECFAAIYTTRAVGGNAEATVGERLALVGDGVFPNIQRLGVEDRVRP